MPELRLSQGSVPYEVHRRRRRTVGVVVRPDGRVEVHAPMRSTASEIRDVVVEFRPWIEKKRVEVLERQRKLRARRFDEGDEVPYLGGTLRLHVVETQTPAEASLGDDARTLTVPVAGELTVASRREQVRFGVKRWLLGQARDVFHRRHVAMSKLVGDAARRVVIKDMRTRWGSCGPERLMNLNWRLILAPEAVIDYVLVHELTHITVPNHSRAFWRKVSAACHHAKASRKWLRAHGDDLEL